MKSRLKHFICLVLLASIASTVQAAHRRTDVVAMYNGDRVTGEIVSLFAGILEYKTDSMGTLKIEWQEISKLQSVFHYEFRLTDGQRYYGSVLDADRPGQLRVEDLYGVHDIEWLDVVEIRPIEARLLDRIDIYLSAGYNYTKASSVAQTSFNTVIAYEDEQTRNQFTGRTVVTNTDDGDTSSTKLDLSRRTWTDRAQLYRVFYGNYETNDELGLDKRIALGLGWGRYAIDNNRMRFGYSAGVQGLTEKTFATSTVEDPENPGDIEDPDAPPPSTSSRTEYFREESAELFLSVEFATWRFDTPELDVQFDATLYPSITNSGRLRGDTDLRVRWEIVEDLFWDITAYGAYDSEAESDDQFDYGVTTGIGWEY
ncbi:MAG: DUF481 domain-containing protein [Halieaceae bacterium]